MLGKIIVIILSVFFFSTAFGQISIAEKSIIKTLNKIDYTSIKGRYNLYDYYHKATLLLLKYDNKELLESVISSYLKSFKYDSNHVTLEPFLPYYVQNKAKVVSMIKKLASVKETKDFFTRLDIAEREWLHGNG